MSRKKNEKKLALILRHAYKPALADGLHDEFAAKLKIEQKKAIEKKGE